MINTFKSDVAKCEIITATKSVVDALLAANTENRRVRKRHVDFLKRQFENGDYALTNQGVGIDTDGVLIDGQHRLLALAAAGYPPVDILVVQGLPKTARAAIDTGVNRTFADLMHFAFDRPEASASMISTARFWGLQLSGLKCPRRPSAQEVCDWYLALLPAMEKVFAISNISHKLSAPVLAAVCHRLTHVPSDERPLAFLEQVLTGANLSDRSPALKLRNWLSEKRQVGGGRAMQIERYQRTAAALSAYLDERELTKLYGGKNAAQKMLDAKAA